jgi:hypothetical protein
VDATAFDRIARLLGGAATRRSGLKAALGASLGLAIAPADGSAKEHGKRDASRAATAQGNGPSAAGPCKKNRCKRDGQCCTGYCLIEKGKKTGKCRCIAVNKPCKKNQTCCGTLACTKGVCTSTKPGRIATGDPCSPGDVCKNAVAACVPYATGNPDGTYCLYPEGTACGNNSVCASGACVSGSCGPAGIPTGGACAQGDTCLDPTANCVAYHSGAPAGAYCLLASGKTCAADGDCISGSCTGNVCAVGLGEACTNTDTCAGDSTCSTYLLGAPVGTFCLLPATKTCENDDHCESSFCTKSACAAACTVCASGCPQTSISSAWSAASAGDEIGIAPGTYDLAIGSIGMDITFRRCGSTGTVAWGNSTYAHTFDVQTGNTLTLGGLSLTAIGSSPSIVYLGGANGSTTKLVAKDVEFHDLVSADYAAVGFDAYVDGEFTNCVFSNNTGSDSYGGGAVYINGGSVSFTDCTFTGNKNGTNDSYEGGAVYAESATSLAFTGSTFTGNGQSGFDGGAMMLSSVENLTLTDCTFTDNIGEDGGALVIEGGSFTISGCTFTGNVAEARGGAIWADFYAPDTGTIINTTMSNNEAQATYWSAGGGAIWAYGRPSPLTVTDSTFSGNKDAARGGAIFIYVNGSTDSTLTFTGTNSITGNSVTDPSGAGSAIAILVDQFSGGSVTVTGAAAAVSGNTTPPAQCSYAASNNAPTAVYSEAVGCVFP